MIEIINLTQKVKIKWFTRNKQKYINLGYKFTKLSDEFEVYVYDLEKNSNTNVDVICDECGDIINTPYRNYNKIVEKSGAYRCRKCNAKYVSAIRINNYAEKAAAKFNRYIMELGYSSNVTGKDYKGHDVPMTFYCNKHGEQKLSLKQLDVGVICPECGKENRNNVHILPKSKVKEMIESKNNNKILNINEYENARKNNLLIQCGSCGNVFKTSLSSLQNSKGHCKKCADILTSNGLKLSTDELIKNTKVNDISYLLNPQNYINSYCTNLEFKCYKCKKVFLQSYRNYKRGYIYCKKCSNKSIGENKIIDVLDLNNVNYIPQKTFDDCKDKRCLPFDFYLPDYNTCIEFDGWQHYHVTHDNVEKFELIKKHDLIKDNYCINNNINLIRIPYWEFKNIDNIINEFLIKCS